MSRSPKTAPAPPPGDAAARVDKDLVTRAYRKVMDGQELTKPERAALKRHEKDKEERLRRQYYAGIPQKHWREMSGRQTKVLNEQATRYGIPFGGATINLPAVVRALHDFLADNAVKLAREDDPLLQGGPASPALERYREERAILARLDRMEREGHLLPRDTVRQAMGRIAAIPQKHWREMSGRQTKVLNEQAARYGIPFGGATINLPAVVRALHDFLADNAAKLAREDDPLMQGNSASPALEAYRVERAALARLDRMERERLLVPRDDVRQALGRIAAILRNAGEALQRQCGPAGVDILFEALDDAQREIDRSFGDVNVPDDDTAPDAQ
jgi:IS4 transposase